MRDGQDEDDEGPIYQVPPPPRPSIGDVAPEMRRGQDEIPPELMPKKGNSFRMSSALLDRQSPVSNPKPAPRNSYRKSSVDSVRKEFASDRMSRSLDIQDGSNDDVFISNQSQSSDRKELPAGPVRPLPVVPKRTGMTEKSTAQGTSSPHSDTTAEPLSQTSTSSSAVRGPVPKPRPRTKVPPPTPQDTSSPLSVSIPQNVSHSSPSIPSRVLEETTIRPSQSMHEGLSPTEASGTDERSSDFSYSLPPDADSLESMLNSEVEKKYGLGHKGDENDTLKGAESFGMDDCNQTAISKETLGENGSDVDDEYVNVDSIDVRSAKNHHEHDSQEILSPPQPHHSTLLPSYFSMKAKPRQKPPSSATESTTSDSQSRSSPLRDSTSRSSPLTNEAQKINLGSQLFQESSSDDISTAEKNDTSAMNPTTPKPFNIQPFKQQVPFGTKADKDEKQGKFDMFDFRDLDPLWVDKTKQASAQESTQKDRPVAAASNSFQPHWESAFPDHTDKGVSDSVETDTYALAGEMEDSPQEHYAQIAQATVPTVPRRPLESTPSFHHAAPVAPPPPFPREQNRIPEPQPPPVPPRPRDVPSPSGPSFLPGAVAVLPSITTNIPTTTEKKDTFFEDFPTPVFSPTGSNDPFRDTNFTEECAAFNVSQGQVTSPIVPKRSAPTPPAKPGATYQEKPGASKPTSATASGDDIDPERISRFVIPPPGSQQGNGNMADYDLASELSSSDSESYDPSQFDGGGGGMWPGANAGPRPNQLTVFDGALSPKKNTKHGYLYKQGGAKANKGWRKRWVVFDGNNLSYYTSKTSLVSKRIIPLASLCAVETDVKQTNFKFKVTTTLKDRVFIFSAENLEDCLKWANTIMAAITDYKKLTNGVEEISEKPVVEGYIKLNTKGCYAAICGKTFRYYQSKEDYQMGSPVAEIDMKLGSVKVKDQKRLQLWTHYARFDLSFDTSQKMQEWRMALEDAIAEGLADDTVLRKVYENMSNQHCADCAAENPHWASINLGIVVCKNCAGIHRMFDYRISKIRSLRMDTRVWTPSLIELMVSIGNANANAFWEFNLPAGGKISPQEDMEKRKEFITTKYRSKKFCNLHPLANQGPVLGDELLKAAGEDNVLEVMKILLSGADVMYRRDKGNPSAYEMAKANGQRLILELLYQNGGDPQSMTGDVTDENRLREDVRLQGFLNKTGPVGRTFERRWCILEHGALTYYLNEKSTTSKGSIDRKDMYMIQAVETDRIGYPFELSTSMKENRLFIFSSDCKDDSGEWMRTIAKLMAPVAVMDHVGMINIKLAGHVYMKESITDEWHQTFIVFSWRGINYMNRDLKFDYHDLRKASSIKMQDSSNGYQQRGPCFVISSTGRSMYLQAHLQRDTERMYNTLLEAVTGSGSTLIDQALTNDNVPVIVERCVTHIYMNGLEEKGIYRTAGQNSRVQALLDEFRRDAWSVSLSEYTVQDVANALKRFLRELDDSVFERINYGPWMNMAGCRDATNRLGWYKYYLERMPQVNYQTLKRIMLHLLQVEDRKDINMMTVKNLASCFAPSLFRTSSDEQPNLTTDASSKEISIIIDLLNNADYFFDVNENDRTIQNNIKKAEIEIQKRMQESRESVGDPTATGILTPFFLLSREGQSVNILVTEEKTAKEAMDYLKRTNANPHLEVYVLHELLFKGALERPLFPEELISATTKRWWNWDSWVLEENSVCLCVQGTELLDKLSINYNANYVLLSKLQYCDAKPKSKFKRKTIGFRQCKLAVYKDSQGASAETSWNVEDITIYLGSHKKQAPSKYCLTFIAQGEVYTKPAFGHCIAFDTEDELYRWAAALYAAQYPNAFQTRGN